MTSRRILRGILLAVMAGVGVAAAMAPAGPASSPPNFSGTWVLNPHRSEFAGETPPLSELQQVEHKGIDLVVTIDEIGERGTVHGVARYTTDGKDVTNDVLGNSMKSSIGWDQDVMILRTWGRFGNADIMLIDRWSLSPDGRTLTIARRFQGRSRVVDQTLVFDRQ
jgi:hypothetical protein